MAYLSHIHLFKEACGVAGPAAADAAKAMPFRLTMRLSMMLKCAPPPTPTPTPIPPSLFSFRQSKGFRLRGRYSRGIKDHFQRLLRRQRACQRVPPRLQVHHVNVLCSPQPVLFCCSKCCRQLALIAQPVTVNGNKAEMLCTCVPVFRYYRFSV